MSTRVPAQPTRLGTLPLASGLGSSPADSTLAAELARVIFIGLSPSIASHLMEPIRAVAANADIQMTRPADLGVPRSLPRGTLLVLQDRRGSDDGLETLRQLRLEGVSTPAILVVTGSDFICPQDVESLGDLDVLPLAEFSRFAFRRSLILLGSRAAREKLLTECASRLRAYERILASKDEERLRVLDVAKSLEHRLSKAEAHSQVNESAWAERLERADACIAELEQRLSELEGGAMSLEDSQPERRRRDKDRRPMKVRDVRQVRVQGAAAIHEAAEREQMLNLTARLQASERVRMAQTRELLSCQRRIGELEQNLRTIAVLVESEQETASIDPSELLEKLAGRLMQIDSVRSDQQETIDRLSHSLAIQRVDEALDHGESRRNVIQRVREVIERSRRFARPVICLMIGIDHPLALRQDLGSVSFDFMLVQVAQRLHLTLRHGDVVMRYGDGEFLLISDAKSTEQAESHAARLVQVVSSDPLELGGRQVEISLSIGILAFRPEMGDAHELIRRARSSLFEAQAKGERQVVVSAEEGGSPPPPVDADAEGLAAS